MYEKSRFQNFFDINHPHYYPHYYPHAIIKGSKRNDKNAIKCVYKNETPQIFGISYPIHHPHFHPHPIIKGSKKLNWDLVCIGERRVSKFFLS